MIPQRNLSLLSNRLARQGGRRLPEAVLERDYCLAWFLVGLSRSNLGQQLAFKGGTALKRCYFGDYRFSEDLDFTLLQPLELQELLDALEPVFAEIFQASGIRMRLSRQDRVQHFNGHAFYLGYEGPIPGAAREVKVDVTRREHLVFPVAQQVVLRGYDEYEDLPDDATISVYSLHEIGTEKTVALQDRARNEPRDLYDIWHLQDHIDLADLQGAVEDKWTFRKENLPSAVRGTLEAKEERLRRMWTTRLSAQMVELPAFDEVFRSVRRAFRQANLE